MFFNVARLDKRGGWCYTQRRMANKSRGESGQAAIEYLLTTLTLVTIFAGMYGFLHGALRTLFIRAGVRILTSYY